jgi:hypothetical protein
MVSQDVKFDEDVWSSRSQVSPLVIEGSEEVVVPDNSKVREESDPSVDEESLRKDMSSPSTPTHKKPRWLTQTLQDAQEHVGAPNL